MKLIVFAGRNAKEMLRDPINLGFGIGFPIILLLLLTAIQSNVPVDIFQLDKLTPGIAVFGLSFITLFSATLISKDRSSSFLARLFTTPMSSAEFILGYTLPLMPMAIVQAIICYITAIILGMEITPSIIIAIILIIPMALLFISLGLLCGSIFNDKQVGGICGALLTNLTAWLSGAWFDLDLVGGAFKKVAYFLPFVHGVDMGKAAISGNYADIFPHIWWILGYGIVITVIAIYVFSKRMKHGK
ncbi:ABC transporter permease [Alloiococcus sp. CFN-8]|uniref:ABC transporter permease n=1 Tax=Alloiococcus sp. CFN-8 TaxID=3416081 RepID=UPI003CF54E3A